MSVIQKMNQEINFRLKWLLIKLEHFIAYDWSRQLLESLNVKKSFTIACNACFWGQQVYAIQIWPTHLIDTSDYMW